MNDIPRPTSTIVPLADRVRYMRLFRLAAVALVVVCKVAAPGLLRGSTHQVLVGTGCFLGASVAGEVLWRLLGRRNLRLLGAMPIVDGAYLAWLSFVTGATVSPIRYLIVVYLVAVVLLVSYRTGLKVACWESIALLVLYNLERSGALKTYDAPASAVGSHYTQLLIFIMTCWIVTLATAASSAVNERELRRRRLDLEALATLAADLEAVREQGEVAKVVLGHVTETFGFERGVALLTEENGRVSLLASVGTAEAPPPPFLAAASVVRRAASGSATLLEDGADETADTWLCEAMPELGHLLVVPMSFESGEAVVLVLEQPRRGKARVERRVVSTVERFAAYGTLALRNASLLEQLTRSAATDALTGVANRRTFDGTLSRELARASRAGEAVSLVMVDLDHFKALNDSHGHQAGDEVLVQVARLLRKKSRSFDTVARYGGEEFALVLPSCPADEAAALAERLRRAVAEAPLTSRVTASVGVATFPVDASDVVSLIGAADEALYRSKRAGRNRVTMFADALVPAESIS